MQEAIIGGVVAGILALTEMLKQLLKRKAPGAWAKLRDIFFVFPMCLAVIAGIATAPEPETIFQTAMFYLGAVWAAHFAGKAVAKDT